MGTLCTKTAYSEYMKPLMSSDTNGYKPLQHKDNFRGTTYFPNQYSDDSPTTFKNIDESFPIIDLIIKAVRSANRFENNVLNQKLDELINEVKELKSSSITIIKINRLETKFLRCSLDVIVEPDGDGFIARATEFPLFGYGEDFFEAVEALKSEIESLYLDLMEDDEFTDEWKNIKNFLNEQVVNI